VATALRAGYANRLHEQTVVAREQLGGRLRRELTNPVHDSRLLQIGLFGFGEQAMADISASRFASALYKLPVPGGRQMLFLRAHYNATNREMSATALARKARYREYRAINLHYGLLGTRIGGLVGRPSDGIDLLVDFRISRAAGNKKEVILIMRPQFAKALKQVGWV
jgi:hypothetical protein